MIFVISSLTFLSVDLLIHPLVQIVHSNHLIKEKRQRFVTSDNIAELVIELVKLLLKKEILATMTSCVDLDFYAWQFKALYNIIAPLSILFPQVSM